MPQKLANVSGKGLNNKYFRPFGPCGALQLLYSPLQCQRSHRRYTHMNSHGCVPITLFFKFIFNLRIIALQCYVGFCYTTTHISHSIHMSPPSWASLSPPSHLIPLGGHGALGWASCIVQHLPTSELSNIWFWTCFNTTLPLCPTLFFSHYVYKSVLCICFSISALKIRPMTLYL